VKALPPERAGTPRRTVFEVPVGSATTEAANETGSDRHRRDCGRSCRRAELSHDTGAIDPRRLGIQRPEHELARRLGIGCVGVATRRWLRSGGIRFWREQLGSTPTTTEPAPTGSPTTTGGSSAASSSRTGSTAGSAPTSSAPSAARSATGESVNYVDGTLSVEVSATG
jgi:hypothetical protein